ncbi:hypothetical protein As57867_002977, partial [Aphanomyces stellatus]
MQAALILSVVAASAAAQAAVNATTCGAEFSTCGFDSNVLSCCSNLKCHKFKDGFGQCLKPDFKPSHKDVEDDEQNGATFVSVEGDATYAVYGPVCGGNGAGCPKKGDVAVKDCVKNVRSFLGDNKCVAPEDATCKKIKTGAWGCVWNSQSPQKDAEDSEQAGCTNVSVVGDATYCVQGKICGAEGDVCPKKGAVAVADCLKTLNSYVDATKCVAPVDGVCQKLPSGARGCVFGAVPVATTTAAPATGKCTEVSVEGDATYCIAGDICSGSFTEGGDLCPKKGDVATKDCVKNARSYVDAAKCVAPEDAECKKLKTGAYGCVWSSQAPQKDAEDGEAAAWQQCGGNNYKGDTSCAAGTKCVVVNDWYSQCQPLPTKDGQVATWQQCGGSTYKGLTVCRDEDVCQKWNDYYSQCIPKTQAAPKKEAEQQSGTVDRFGQCGGKEYKGNTKCGDADKCQSWNE